MLAATYYVYGSKYSLCVAYSCNIRLFITKSFCLSVHMDLTSLLKTFKSKSDKTFLADLVDTHQIHIFHQFQYQCIYQCVVAWTLYKAVVCNNSPDCWFPIIFSAFTWWYEQKTWLKLCDSENICNETDWVQFGKCSLKVYGCITVKIILYDNTIWWYKI